jgi:ABC-type lipoprotein export system ATPase subunit
MAKDLLLKLDNLVKSYEHPAGRVEVLKGVSLNLNNGDTVAITGPSGSGKSTLLNLVGCLDRPDSGKMIYKRNSLSELSQTKLDEFRLCRIGIVFQAHHLLPQCTALENVLLPTLPVGGDLEEAAVRAEELLALAGLHERRNHFPGELSGGECQRVAVCRALINSPELLLADEPTGALDHQTALELLELLDKLANDSMALLMVTHSSEAAARMKRRFELKEGILQELAVDA